MRGAWRALVSGLLGLAMAWPVQAQDTAKVQQLVNRIENRAEAFWPDARVSTSRAPLFRGELSDVKGALDELVSLGDAAIPGLLRLLHNRSAQCRANAAYALAAVGGPAIVPPLAFATRDLSAGVRYQAAISLGYSASAGALVPLNVLAGDQDAAVRSAAVVTGGVLRDIIAAEAAPTPDEKLAELVALTGSEVACARLISYGAAAVPTLIKALDSKDQGVVTGATYCLSEIGDTAGLEPLWKRFEESLTKTPDTRFARYIAAYRNPEVIRYLQQMLESPTVNDKAPLAQYYALERLAVLDNPQRLGLANAFVKRQIEAKAHMTRVRSSTTASLSPIATGCEVLGQIGDRSSLPLLEQIINEAPPPEQSIVKPLAEQAKAAILKRG